MVCFLSFHASQSHDFNFAACVATTTKLRSFNLVGDSEKMSRYHLKQYEKEHMKMAMLKQEETFRQQVIN